MELKREFLAWEREALRGFAIRSRVQSTAEEETSTFHMNKSTKGIRGALNRTKPTKNDPGLSVVAQSLNAQAFNRGVLGSIPESDNPLVSPFTVEEINNALRATKKNKAPGRKSKEVSSLKPAAIIAYDLEKAYDLVNRDVLWEVMTAMGYPPLCLSRGIDGIEHYGKRIQVRAIERTATVYWLGPHLKNLLPQITQPRFNATHSSHPYFTTSLSTITDLLKAGIFTSSTVSNHRATYNHLIANIGQPGRTEIAKPDLDWASIWRVKEF
ncbi:uncharacterized protein LOC123475943 [Daphnia magna]|uniref:uncharacterized protein LOC123475943 n=1 Tax=Daphnia magna TaxID=35525 RepID=UPI001E1BB0FB|nr:uncharacterized protein LOC123475943 [Daphnia magna]